MNVESERKRNEQLVDDIMKEIERESFIYREKEMDLFKECLTKKERFVKVLHIYGPGGVGKTSLLGDFSRFSEDNDVLFLWMDSGDYGHTPEDFSKHILALLSERDGIDLMEESPYQKTYQYSLQILNDLAERGKIVIAIDSYPMHGLDRWFRQVFVRKLHPNILIVLAGRKSLQGEWITSPVWGKMTRQMELHNFNIGQTRSFLVKSGVQQEKAIQTLWRFTKGHPLTLSLAILTNEEIDFSNPADVTEKIPQILIRLTKVWLQEVIDEALLYMVEIAALFHTFDQSSLSTILNQEISATKFNELTSYSFMKRAKGGWAMHDLIKDAVRVELQYRNPDYYKLLTDRLISHYYKKTIASRSVRDISQFFYHLGDEAIQSAFFQDRIDTSFYLEPVEHYNFYEVTRFFNQKRQEVGETDVQFYDRLTHRSVRFHVSEQHNEKEMALMDASYILKMGYKSVQLLKEKAGDTLGISIVVPIHQETLVHLVKEPVSRAYFSRLSQKEWDYYDVPKEESRGMFIRMLDYTEAADTSARSFLLYNLFTYLLSGGKIIASTPLPFFQDLLRRFGFIEVAQTTHFDYGENVPSPTYLLDVSGANFAIYLKKFMDNITESNQMKAILDSFSFTNREREVVMLVLENKSNAGIAKQLYIAEVTVKKHMTNILKKVCVSNRTELIKMLIELM